MSDMHISTRGMFHVICDFLSMEPGREFHIHGVKERITIKTHKDYNKCKVMKSVHSWLDFYRRKETFDNEESFINYVYEPTEGGE